MLTGIVLLPVTATTLLAGVEESTAVTAVVLSLAASPFAQVHAPLFGL